MKLADMVEEGRCCRRNISVEYSERSEFSALHVEHWRRMAYVCKFPGSAACVSFHVAATPLLNRRQSLSSNWAGPSRRYGLPRAQRRKERAKRQVLKHLATIGSLWPIGWQRRSDSTRVLQKIDESHRLRPFHAGCQG